MKIIGKFGVRIHLTSVNSLTSEWAHAIWNLIYRKLCNFLELEWVKKLTYTYINNWILRGSKIISLAIHPFDSRGSGDQKGNTGKWSIRQRWRDRSEWYWVSLSSACAYSYIWIYQTDMVAFIHSACSSSSPKGELKKLAFEKWEDSRFKN